jgi:transposase-like protein
MKHLISVEEALRHAKELRELRWKERAQQRKETARPTHRFGARTDMRSRAIQAFWAMHVEALNWSGMSLEGYANALLLSPWALRKWRARFDNGEVAIDWRTLLHPSARPLLSTIVSTSANDGAKEPPVESLLTAPPEPEPSPSRTRPRRSFTDAEKHAIVLETERPGATVSQVARDHGIVTSVLFRWRAQRGLGKGKTSSLVAVRIADERGVCDADATAAVLQNVLPIPPDAVAVELADGRCVFAPAGSDPEAVRQYIAEREEDARC